MQDVADPRGPCPRWTSSLWAEGSVPPPPRVAIVGARACSARARAFAQQAVAVAERCRFAVVSGGARGIDAVVHRTALARAVPQVAFIPCFRDDPYPPEHADLFGDIIGAPHSAVVYARGPGSAPSRGMFLSRNRIVVAAARAVIVVEAGLRSGSVATGRLALEHGRPVLVMRGSAGAAALVEQGARMIDFEPGRPAEAIETLARWLQGRGATARAWPAAIVQALQGRQPGRRWIGADDFEDPALGAMLLLEAEADGALVEVSPGRYVPA